ncbi:MAG: sugar phosphate isomerase/epimerase [Bryobacterales bacterium]|nr:sugar phosphate isomerase/epimerase [Bryobacterales bacterium]
MRLGLINSAWAGTHVGTAEGIRKTKEIGFDTIDIFADPLDADARERRLIRDTCREAGLPIVSVCCVACGLPDFSASVRRFHVDRCKAYLDMVYDFEARNLLLVLGEYIWQQEVIAPRDQWRWAVEGVRALGEHARSLDLEIALELEPFRLSLINNLESMERFLDDVDHPSVRANLDVSHLALAGTPASDVPRLKGRIAHVHFSDCDGKVHGDLPPGRGVVDFIPYLSALKDAGYGGAVSIELEYSPEPDRIVEWVTEAYSATDRLMRGLGIRG